MDSIFFICFTDDPDPANVVDMKDHPHRFGRLAMDYAELYLGKEEFERLKAAADNPEATVEAEPSDWLERLRSLMRRDPEGRTS